MVYAFTMFPCSISPRLLLRSRSTLYTRRPFSRNGRNSSTNKNNDSQLQQQDQLREANAQMAAYHDARIAMKQGRLKQNSHYSKQNNSGVGRIQFAIAGVFVLGFLSMPLLGKKIAQDDEFRQKYIPKWYDYTIRKPENAWTRDELHEQMLQVQKEVRERAIRGDFAPEKLSQMQASLDQIDRRSEQQQNMNQSQQYNQRRNDPNVPHGWDSIHPGAGANGESSLHED